MFIECYVPNNVLIILYALSCLINTNSFDLGIINFPTL